MSGHVLLGHVHRPDIALPGIDACDERGGAADKGKEADKAHEDGREAGMENGLAPGGGQIPPNAMVFKGLR
jgi:hypothetical protein